MKVKAPFRVSAYRHKRFPYILEILGVFGFGLGYAPVGACKWLLKWGYNVEER
jgi:hypothetical protein